MKIYSYFPFKRFIVLVLTCTYICDLFELNFVCDVGKASELIDSFACEFPVVPATSVERLFFPVEESWHSCKKPVGHTFEGLFLDSVPSISASVSSTELL